MSVHPSSYHFFSDLYPLLEPASLQPSQYMLVRYRDGAFGVEARTASKAVRTIQQMLSRTSYDLQKHSIEIITLVNVRLALQGDQSKELLAARKVLRIIAQIGKHNPQTDLSGELPELINKKEKQCLQAVADLEGISQLKLLCDLQEFEGAYQLLKATLTEVNFELLDGSYQKLFHIVDQNFRQDDIRIGLRLLPYLSDSFMVEIQQRFGWIQHALQGDKIDICCRLIESCQKGDELLPPRGQECLLLQACQKEALPIVIMLLQKGLVANVTHISCAIEKNHLPIIELLLTHKTPHSDKQLTRVKKLRAREAFRKAFMVLDHTLTVGGTSMAVNKKAIANETTVFAAMWNSGMRESQAADNSTLLPDDAPQPFQDCFAALSEIYIIEQEEDIDRLIALYRLIEKYNFIRLSEGALSRIVKLFQKAAFSDEEKPKQLGKLLRQIGPLRIEKLGGDLADLIIDIAELEWENLRLRPFLQRKDTVLTVKHIFDALHAFSQKFIQLEIPLPFSFCLKKLDLVDDLGILISRCKEFAFLQSQFHDSVHNFLKLCPKEKNCLYYLTTFQGLRGLPSAHYQQSKNNLEKLLTFYPDDAKSICAYVELLLSGAEGSQGNPSLARSTLERFFASPMLQEREPTSEMGLLYTLTLGHICKKGGFSLNPIKASYPKENRLWNSSFIENMLYYYLFSDEESLYWLAGEEEIAKFLLSLRIILNPEKFSLQELKSHTYYQQELLKFSLGHCLKPLVQDAARCLLDKINFKENI